MLPIQEESKTLANLIKYYNKHKPFPVDSPFHHIPMISHVVKNVVKLVHLNSFNCVEVDDLVSHCWLSLTTKIMNKINYDSKYIGGYLFKSLRSLCLNMIKNSGSIFKIPDVYTFAKIKNMCEFNRLDKSLNSVDDNASLYSSFYNFEMNVVIAKENNKNHFEEYLETEEAKELLNSFKSTLKTREKKILNLYLAGVQQYKISEMIGLSRERVRQFLRKIIIKGNRHIMLKNKIMAKGF